MNHAGRIPPQALDLEQRVLGAILLQRDAIERVVDKIQPAMFYKDAHLRIYEAALALYKDSKPIDIITVKDRLSATDGLELVGGMFYLADLTAKVASAANIEYHAQIVAQKYLLREAAKIAGEAHDKAYAPSTDPFELFEATSSAFEALTGGLGNDRGVGMDEACAQFFEHLADLERRRAEARENGEAFVAGVPSGWEHLDQMTTGFHGGELIIVAGRPAMGKTAFVLGGGRNMARAGHPGAIFSLEMDVRQLMSRLVSAEAGVDLSNLRTGDISPQEHEQISLKMADLAKLGIHIDDTPGLSLMDLKIKARRLKRTKGIEWIIIDYIQLMKGEQKRGGNREQEIASIARGLKELAKELDIPIIALSQLNRGVELRKSKRPMLSDLRESGSIEQDADMVLMLYRPSYYGEEYLISEYSETLLNIDLMTGDKGMEKLREAAFILIVKQRQGPIGDVPLRFVPQRASFATQHDQRILRELGYDGIPESGLAVVKVSGGAHSQPIDDLDEQLGEELADFPF